MRSERSDDLPANTRVIRWVVEHQARGVMLIKQSASSEFGSKHRFLIRAEILSVAINPPQMGVSCKEVAAIRTPVNRIERAQGRIGGIGVFVKLPTETVGIECRCDGATVPRCRELLRHAL